MQLKAGNYCPLLQKECIGIQCAWFTQIRGQHPQTGEEIDEWDCAVKLMPMLQIEVAHKANQTAACVESFRNEVVKSNQENQQIYIHYMENGMINPQVNPINSLNASDNSKPVNKNILGSGDVTIS